MWSTPRFVAPIWTRTGSWSTSSEVLAVILEEMNYRNLDDEPAFAGKNTTTEFLARQIWERIVAAVRAGRLGDGARGLSTICVKLNESHVAWGSYEGAL